MDRAEKIDKLSEVKSVIFKQKIKSWARKYSEFDITSKIKISYIKK